jgi:hypothetical protein
LAVVREEALPSIFKRKQNLLVTGNRVPARLNSAENAE